MYIRSKIQSGFTIIELLVVVAIIAILASIVLASLSSPRNTAQNVARLASAKEMKSALELYYFTNQQYPSVASNGGPLSQLSSALVPTYMERLPQDLIDSDARYVMTGAGQNYGIRIKFADGSFCKTGVNVDPNWWGNITTVPLCDL